MTSTIRGTDNFDSAWGNGQTWQDVTASRALATTYTNSTSAPIYVSVVIASNGTWNSSLTVNSVAASQAYFVASGGTMTMTAIVPAGGTYRAASTVPIGGWFELR